MNSAGIVYIGTAITATSTPMANTTNLVALGKGGTYAFQVGAPAGASLYQLVTTYTPSSAADAATSAELYLQGATNGQVVYAWSALATGIAQMQGPFAVARYGIAAGTPYVIQARGGTGTGYLQVDMYWTL